MQISLLAYLFYFFAVKVSKILNFVFECNVLPFSLTEARAKGSNQYIRFLTVNIIFQFQSSLGILCCIQYIYEKFLKKCYVSLQRHLKTA